MNDSLETQLTDIFHQVFADDSIVVTRDLTADKVEGWDSLTHVRLLLTIERKLGVSIHAGEAARLKTVGDLIDLLHKKMEAKKV